MGSSDAYRNIYVVRSGYIKRCIEVCGRQQRKNWGI